LPRSARAPEHGVASILFTMRIDLQPELERFAKAAAKTYGFASIGEYLQHLLEAERAPEP